MANAAGSDRIEALIEKFCGLSILVAKEALGFPRIASDCFCAGSPARQGNWNFEHNPAIYEFIEKATIKALADYVPVPEPCYDCNGTVWPTKQHEARCFLYEEE